VKGSANQDEGDAWKVLIGFLRSDDGLFGSDEVLEWAQGLIPS
jgi:hypothetical protein